jgi:YVTN family beta-propeller protein
MTSRLSLTALAASVLLLAMGAQAAFAGQPLYVPNTTADTVSVIDTDTGALTRTIPVKGLPFIAAPTADGKKVYIDNLGVNVNGVSVVNTADGSVKLIKTKFPPFAIVLSPDQTKVYALKATQGLTSGIDVIDTATDTIVKSYNVGSIVAPVGLQISPDGKTVYISYVTGSIGAFDAATGKQVFKPKYFGGVLPAWLSLSRDGKHLYVLNFVSGDTAVVDTQTWTQVAKIDNGGINAEPAISAENLDGTKLYITNFGTQTIQVVDKATWKEVGLIKTEGRPLGITVAADGTGYYSDWGLKSVAAFKPPVATALTWAQLFIAGKGSLDKIGNGQVVHFDTDTLEILGKTTVGVTPNIIEVGPLQ